ncbi:YHYH protein [Falsirhodobacter sp. alg1]|uniref:YHYH protein n=1 Tax=Falsirhodobacter sp. alg1 TaxID=1472418 RepID=UPI0007884089|nr:YHYH protein [Falsirhodobacter sp. alg1]
MTDRTSALRIAGLMAATIVTASPGFAQSVQEERLTAIAGFFSKADVVSGPEIVDCTLSGGAQSNCFSITVRPAPLTYTPGPWCPSNISDGADAGGIWFQDGKAVDVDGEFIANLAKTYGDTEWQLFDPDSGDIRFTGTLEACEAAARPDVDPDYQNYCVQCLPEYVPDETQITYVIPMQPVPHQRDTPTNQTGSGIAYNGIRLDGPAPLDAILGAHTIAPFDDCGGHVNLFVGYHYHAVTNCLDGAPTTIGATQGTSEDAEKSGGQIGIAMDGYAMFSHLLTDGTTPVDLDSCFGHETDGLGYHYHVGDAGSNQILGCLSAESGCVLEGGEMVCDASARPERPGPAHDD